MINKPNIKKHIDSQPKVSYSASKNNSLQNGSSITDSPMFQMAQTFIENMDTKYKLMIAGAIYVLLSGIVANLYLIYKLITIS